MSAREPVEYPVDLRIQNSDVRINESSGDLELTRGFESVEQGAALDVDAALQSVLGETVTPRSLSKLETAVETTLERQPYVADVVFVDVIAVDRRNDRVDLRVIAQDDDEWQLTLEQQ